MIRISTFCLLLLCISLHAVSKTGNFSVKDFGATGNGTTLDTDAINAAIDEAVKHGGGTVYFPAGEYLSFSIRLKSNIRLYIDSGAKIVAATPDEHPGFGYDAPEPNIWGDSLKYQDFGHSHWQNSLIWGIGLENIVIEGHGLIYGKGLQKWGNPKPGLGNKTIALKLCRNVTIRDISILQGGHFGILPTGVDNFTIDNVKIDSNRDGINIDCCRYVRISNSFINTPNDDAIVLKSSFGLGFVRATENVTITNCHVSGFDLGTMLDGTFQTNTTAAPDKGAVTGRIKFGTESNGGFKNIAIANCTFTHCRGFAIETVDGGIIEDVTITNITMRDILDSGFYIRIGKRLRGPDGTPVGKTNRILISNVTITGIPPRYAALVMGIPGHPVEGVTFQNIRMEVQGGAPVSQISVLVPESETDYPDPMYHGDIPASGFFVRHASDVRFYAIEIAVKNMDPRPLFWLEDVSDVELDRINSNGNALNWTVKQARQVTIKNWNLQKEKRINTKEKITF